MSSIRSIEYPRFALQLSALVLTSAESTVVIRKVLESHGFTVAAVAQTATAQQLCAKERFDLGVYDQDVDGAIDFAGAAHVSSRPRIAVGLVRTAKCLQPAGSRFHFVLHKPFTSDLFAKTVKAASGPIAAERRVSFRQTVDVEASDCSLPQGIDRRALKSVTLVNLSQTGLCLDAGEMLPQGAVLELSFRLPPSDTIIHVSGSVVWAHVSGRGGIKFNQLNDTDQRLLEDWLDSAFSGIGAGW